MTKSVGADALSYFLLLLFWARKLILKFEDRRTLHGKSEKKPVQKESNCNDVCKVCQVNLKATYVKSGAIKAWGNIFKPSARKQIRS